MDQLDRSIVIKLQEDARIPDAAIGRAIGISGAAVHRRISRLVSEGTIKVMAVPNPHKVGYPTSAMIGIQVSPARMKAVSGKLMADRRVHSLILTTGPFDLIIWVVFHSPLHIAEFIKSVLHATPGIQRTETMLMIEEIKRKPGIVDDEVGGDGAEAEAPTEQPTSAYPAYGRNDSDPVHTIDDFDHDLIFELQQDARQNDAELARKLGISGATVRRRLERLIREGIITLSAVSIPARVGYPVMVNIGMQLELSKLDAALARIRAMPRVHTAALTTGRYDIWTWASFRAPEDLSAFYRKELANVPGLVRCETLVNLEIPKRDIAILPPRADRSSQDKQVVGEVMHSLPRRRKRRNNRYRP